MYEMRIILVFLFLFTAIGAASTSEYYDDMSIYCNTTNFHTYECTDNVIRVQEKNSIAQIRERLAWLGCYKRHAFSRAISKRTKGEIWALLHPYYPCQWTLEKKPSVQDAIEGGKWMCGLKEIGKRSNCVVYSFGSNNNFKFEYVVRDYSNCEIHIFDPTSNPPSKDAYGKLTESHRFTGKMIYHKIGLSDISKSSSIAGKQFNVSTLRDIMIKNGHWETGVDILKIDVEGFEFSIVQSVDWSLYKIGQILMEAHPEETMDDGAKFVSDARDRKVSRKYLGICDECRYNALHINAFILTLERGGFRFYSSEPVSKKAEKVEIAMINPTWSPQGFRTCESKTIASL